ncbi:hypothetical protein EST38_g6192 [Candolleomyces aberdarensis]|uniref:Uncharacterized protein n=1 Tax=Candolleomyces aberdarensis TaxID=2316362 RepID=A0A4Q2DKH6_9AGAR|nr:hypothetical protein EST38_g6192 [Candolleomyces aberdarensis]
MSSSFCLSSATILRCVPLSQAQGFIILIPTLLEVISTSSLIITLWNSGHRRHLLLTAEGWIYFILSVLELLTRVLGAAQNNVDVFSGLDVTIGVASFVPLFLYTFFLYIYSDSELLPNALSLPKKLGKVACLVLLILIPAIVGSNEVASFVGIQRRTNPQDPAQILIGFTTQRNFSVNAFFSSLSLALVTLFQATIFLITAFRLITAIFNQRRFENLGQDASHMLNGIGWLAAGMKLGAIESVIGFAGGGFEIVLTRRFIRFLARACLSLGIVKGVDEIQDFRAVSAELYDAKVEAERFQPRAFRQISRGPKNSRGLKNLISNPRLSTFRQVTPPQLNGFGHLLASPTFNYNRKIQQSNTSTPETHLRSLQEVKGITTFENMTQSPGRRSDRVTVQYRNSGGAPTLQLRFSTGGFPSPRIMADTVASRPVSEWLSSNQSRNSISSESLRPGNPFWAKDVESATSRSRPQQAPPEPSIVQPNGKLRPFILADTEKDVRSSMSQSLADSPVEIVTAPQRTLSQSSARARIYQASVKTKLLEGPPRSVPAPMNDVRQTMVSMYSTDSQDPPPSKYQPRKGSMDASTVSKFRIVSDYSTFEARPDSIQAVRELAEQFPGPPVTYNGRPVIGGLEVTVWEDDHSTPSMFGKSARSSVVFNAFNGLPSGPKLAGQKQGKGRAKVDDEEKGLGTPSSDGTSAPRIMISNSAPSTARTLRPQPSFVSTARSIDPFEDEPVSPRTPRTPVEEILSRPTLLRPQPRLDMTALRPHAASVPTSPSELMTSPASGYTVTLNPLAPTPGGLNDPFNELAVRTGGSSEIQRNGAKWKHNSSMMPYPPERAFAPGDGLPTTPVRYSSMGEGLSPPRPNFTQNENSSTSSLGRSSRPPSRVTWIPQEQLDEASITRQRKGSADTTADSVQEQRRRQHSIDAAAHQLSNSIPWLKHPEVEEEERKLQKAISASASISSSPGAAAFTADGRQRAISRVKTVGQVNVAKTPTLSNHATGPMRRSVRVEPIMIPPRSPTFAQMKLEGENA